MTALLSVYVPLTSVKNLVCLCVHSWLYSPVRNLFYNSTSTRIHRSIFHNCGLKIQIHFLCNRRISRLHIIIGTTFLLTCLLLLCVPFHILWSLWDHHSICASVCPSLSLLSNGILLIILIAHHYLSVYVNKQQTPWLESASEQYRPSDCRAALLAKLVPTSAD
jgi:hypothetical protein